MKSVIKNIMKIRKYLFLSLIVFMSSCSDWLDVGPKDIVDEDDLFMIPINGNAH